MGLAQLEPSFYAALNQEYSRKRSILCSSLEQAGLRPYVPQGAYYILADVSSLPGKTSKEKAMFLLEQTGVACVPGEAFFHDAGGKNLVRFCFAKTDEKLEEACDRLLLLEAKTARSTSITVG